MLYFSAPPRGCRKVCVYRLPKPPTWFIVLTWLLCFPVLFPPWISQKIEEAKRRRIERPSPKQRLRRGETDRKAYNKHRSKMKRRLRPKTRKRSLTLPYAQGDNSSFSSLSVIEAKIGMEKEIDQQYSSPLFKLPLDLRKRIWKHVLGGRTISIYCGHGRLVHEFEDREDSCGYMYAIGFGPGVSLYRTQPSKTRLTAVLKSCRQVYTEAIDILYTKNTFSLYQNDTIFDLQSTILPHRFASIQSLILHWQFRDDETFERDILGNLTTHVDAPWDVETWRKACKLLSEEMPGLQTLSVMTRGPFTKDECIIDMLESLRGINLTKEKFRVRAPRAIALPEPTDDQMRIGRFENQDFPFQEWNTERGPDSDWGPELYKSPRSVASRAREMWILVRTFLMNEAED